MQANKQQAKPLAKKTQDSEAPYPSFITQVQKDDQNNQSIGSLAKLYSCCMYFWKCFTPKKPATFENIDEASAATLLEPQLPEHKGRKVLVLDLDETLVHSTFEPVQKADLVLPVHIQGMVYKINVIKRPGCEEFIARMGELYEVVVFTASLSEYAEPLCKILDPTNAISSILYRQHCTPLNGVYVKDMTLLGRNMEDIILVDNSPNSFLFQPENAYHIKNFFDDKTDRELYRLAQFLENIIHVPDVRPIEDLRRQYEPQINPKTMKFIKTNRNEVVDLNDSNGLLRANSRHQPAQNNRKEERERTLNIETEPDLRRGDREGQFAQIPDQGGDDDYRPGGFVFKGGAVTERVGFDDNFELPSPKESDGLIFHTNTTGKGKKKTFVPPLAKDVDTFNKLTRGEGEIVVEETHVIDGQKVDDVRLLSDMGNLNSPLGRQVKIEYNKENAI